MGRADHANVHLAGGLRPDPANGPPLQRPQQLGLELQRKVADLVEEEAPAVRQLEEPGLRRVAPVNAPFSWPNSSDSSRAAGIAAQLIATKGAVARGL